MTTPIDNRVLRELDCSGCVSYFNRLRQDGLSEAAITAHLLDAVECQSVPPVPLMSVWLSFSQSPGTIKTALNQNFSRRTRNFALKGFGRLLNRQRWRLLWTEFGGIKGILDLFSQLSICEVGLITRIIGHQIKAGKNLEREAAITDLLRALLGVDGVSAIHKNPDQRYLVGKYLEILPACDTSFVEKMLCQSVEGIPDHEWEFKHFRSHSALICRLTAMSAFGGGPLPDRLFEACLSSCLKNLRQGFTKEFGCSMSMSFALDLLRMLAVEKRSDVPLDKYLQDLFEPILQPSWKKRKSIGSSRMASIAALTISCVSKRPKAIVYRLDTPAGLLPWVVRCWSLQPNNLDEALHTLLERFSSHITTQNFMSVAKPLLRAVEEDLRYRLLRTLFSKSSGPSVDIDSPVALANANNLWDHEIFTILPRKDAVPLLERLRQAKPGLCLSLPYGGSSVQMYKTIVLCPATPQSKEVNTDMLYHYLQRGQEGALVSASKFLTQQKQKAMTSRDQADRAFYAKASLFAAIASGSLPLLKDTMIWLRRYIRDPLTVKTLYDEATFKITELIDLLAGLPETPSKQVSYAEIAETVSSTNAIMKELCETVYQALREPSFHAPDWVGPLSIFKKVTAARLDRVKLCQRVLGLSDEQLYDAVWRDTLQMLIAIEKRALGEENAGLNFVLSPGPLCYRGIDRRIHSKKATPASYRFVDEHARARNVMWQEARRLGSPTAAALQGPWPRGLAFRDLLAPLLDVAEPSAKGCTPYLTARATSIVFTPPTHALARLPTDKETENAIGTFIDDYEDAIKVYVMQESSLDVRKQLVQKAWDHAIQSFTRSPMTEDEKIRYVQTVFKRIFPEYPLPLSSIETGKLQLYPILPRELTAIDINEWDPSAAKPSDIKHKILDPRVIDCMFTTYSSWESFSTYKVSLPGWSADPIWSLQRFTPGRVKRDQREALIVSRLLYLDSKIGGKPGLLAHPFPSAGDSRYPALFLDSDFLLRDDLGHLDLRSFTVHVPVVLVRRLADNAMEELLLEEGRVKNADGLQEGSKEVRTSSGSTTNRGSMRDRGPPGFPARGSHKNGTGRAGSPGQATTVSSKSRIMELERILYDLVVFLAVSDKPQLAADLSLRIILDRPEASSWHRKLLGIKYLQCLPSADVRVVFSDFVQGLSQRLAEQDAHKDNKEWKGKYVKTTTLKYVAQLLNEAEFISRPDAVNLLVKLYSQAKNIDVRAAVIESLLGMLTPCRDESNDPVANAIIEGLTATVSIIGSPSERCETTEKDWLEAEKTGVLPETRADIPIATLIIDAVAGKRFSIDLRYRRRIMSEILLPGIHASALTNERWVKLFASQQNVKFEASETHGDLLAYPIKPSLVSTVLLLSPTLTPNHILRRYHHHTLALLNLPADFVALRAKIESDLDLRTSSAGKTFLSLYDNSPQTHRDTTIYHSLLRPNFKPSLLEQNGIILNQVQEMLCDLAPEFLTHYDEEPEHFDTFVNQLHPPFHILSAVGYQNWTTNIKPILERIISSIEDARANLSANSRPSVLPDTFKLQLWLLSCPVEPSLSGHSATLPAAIISILESITCAPAPVYHTYFLQLQNMITQLPSTDLHVQIALKLGERIGSRSKLCRALIEELQKCLLLGVKGNKVRAELLQSVKEFAEVWIAEEDEERRRGGFAVKRAAEKAKVA